MRHRRRSPLRPLALAVALLLVAGPRQAARYTPSRTILPGPLTIQSGDVTLTSGQWIIPTGSVTVPSMTFIGDLDTGFSRIGENQVVFVGGSDGRVLFDGGDAFVIRSDVPLAFTSSTSITAARDVLVRRGGAGIWEQRDGTNAQETRIENTFTDDNNRELTSLGFQNNTNEFTIQTEALGTGVVRAISLRGGNVGVGLSPPAPGGAAGSLHVLGFLHVQAALAYGAHVVTIASNGVSGTANGETLSGLRSVYLVECLDGDGCTVTVAESGVAAGAVVKIFNISTSGSANHNLTMSDAAPLHLAGALTLAASQSVTLMYVVNRSGDGNFYESSRSAN